MQENIQECKKFTACSVLLHILKYLEPLATGSTLFRKSVPSGIVLGRWRSVLLSACFKSLGCNYVLRIIYTFLGFLCESNSSSAALVFKELIRKMHFFSYKKFVTLAVLPSALCPFLFRRLL